MLVKQCKHKGCVGTPACAVKRTAHADDHRRASMTRTALGVPAHNARARNAGTQCFTNCGVQMQNMQMAHDKPHGMSFAHLHVKMHVCMQNAWRPCQHTCHTHGDDNMCECHFKTRAKRTCTHTRTCTCARTARSHLEVLVKQMQSRRLPTMTSHPR